jgi:RNA polymerase primary sigma factor
LGREATEEDLSLFYKVSEEKIIDLLEKSEAAKKILVKTNMRLIFHIARFYKFRGVAYPDLIQEGTFGLIKAIDRYDPDRGFRFSTYASWWIKQSISRAVAEKSRIVRLPVHVHDLMVSVSKAERQFSRTHLRKPTPIELAERLALPLQKVELLIKCSREVNSIDENVYQNKGKLPGGNEIQVKDRLISEACEPSSMNDFRSFRSEIRRVMESLSDREMQIVEMRFGLTDGNPMTLEEIGKHFNVTRERIRQIEARAMSKMRNPEKLSELKEACRDQAYVVNTDVFLSSSASGLKNSLDHNNNNKGNGGNNRELNVVIKTSEFANIF